MDKLGNRRDAFPLIVIVCNEKTSVAWDFASPYIPPGILTLIILGDTLAHSGKSGI